jgi:hypothetical protein
MRSASHCLADRLGDELLDLHAMLKTIQAHAEAKRFRKARRELGA